MFNFLTFINSFLTNLCFQISSFSITYFKPTSTDNDFGTTVIDGELRNDLIMVQEQDTFSPLDGDFGATVTDGELRDDLITAQEQDIFSPLDGDFGYILPEGEGELDTSLIQISEDFGIHIDDVLATSSSHNDIDMLISNVSHEIQEVTADTVNTGSHFVENNLDALLQNVVSDSII